MMQKKLQHLEKSFVWCERTRQRRKTSNHSTQKSRNTTLARPPSAKPVGYPFLPSVAIPIRH